MHPKRRRTPRTMQSLHLGHISSRCCASRQHRTRTSKPACNKLHDLTRGPTLRQDAPARRSAGDRLTICLAVINHEVSTADSWALSNRAAMLHLRVEQLEEYIQSNSGANAWLAVCEPERLFALQELCKLLQADVGIVLQLVAQEPALLDVPARSLEDNTRGIQALLQLPRPAVLQLLCAAPSLLLEGPKAIKSQLQRVCRGLGLNSTAPEAASLLQLLPVLGIDAWLDPAAAVRKLSPFISALSVEPAAAVKLLWAEASAGHDLQQVLSAPTLEALSRKWHSLSDELRIPLSDLMGMMSTQVALPDARYLATSTQLFKADITALQDASQLDASTVCRMLLAAPRLARVPASFWQLLLQYILFLVPHWRQQLEDAPASEAGVALAQLFDITGCDITDSVPVTQRQALFTTADMDFNQELTVLEALLDHGVTAPRFAAPGEVVAGRLWRLIYMCNPRLDAAQQAQAAPTSSSSSSSSSWAWSWVQSLQLPLPLVNQMQRQGALACDLEQHAAWLAAGAHVGPELVESLADVIESDSNAFCARHPGYPHWLHNAAFELEWSNSKAAAPVQTWDP